jgi:hypothetical protein
VEFPASCVSHEKVGIKGNDVTDTRESVNFWQAVRTHLAKGGIATTSL